MGNKICKRCDTKKQKKKKKKEKKKTEQEDSGSWFQIVLQSYSHQSSMVLAQKQIEIRETG